jgi:hypothetical protein
VTDVLGGLKASDLDELAELGMAKLYEKARTDFNLFAELVMVDDETGEPIRQAPIHRRWAELCEEHDRLLIWSHINSGKTTQLSILRSVYELGNDPNLRILILSNTASIATKIVKAISALITDNEAVKAIFPKLEPHPKGPWTTTELTVKRSSFAKDPSVRAVGVHGSLTSARVDRLIVDDILDPENVATEASRKKLSDWYKAVAVGRLTAKAKIVVVGTAYHPKDLLHELAAQKRFKAVRFPVINSKGKVAWANLWPQERINRMREELGPAEFARQLLCLARDDEEARFKQVWIDEALRKGEGQKLIYRLDEALGEGFFTFTGVDIGVKKGKRNDLTALFTFIEDPNGVRTLLWLEAGKFTGPEIVRKIEDHHERYQSFIAVENNSAQDFILQFMSEGSTVPVIPHTTGRMKKDPLLGVEGLAVELAKGRWVIPNDANKAAPEVEAWIQEMLFYTPQLHTGDRLMASYFAREVARKKIGNRAMPGVRMRVLGGESPPEVAPAAA